MRKPTVTTLMLLQEIERLQRRVAELEARPPVVIHNHPPAEPRVYGSSPFVQHPAYPPGWPLSPVISVAYGGTDELAPIWNGPRNPGGSCAPLGEAFVTGLTIAAPQNGGGSSCITAHGGGSGG